MVIVQCSYHPILIPSQSEQTRANSATEDSLLVAFPYTSLLQSNDIPTDEEVLEINALLSQPTKELGMLASEMTKLQTALDGLRQRYDNLHNQVALCRSVTSLARRIPSEILSEIFCMSLPTNSYPVLNSWLPPLIFTHICRRWRDIAISTPKLWSSIRIEVLDVRMDGGAWWSDYENSGYPSILETWHNRRALLVTQWLRRAGNNVSLSIKLCNVNASSESFNIYLNSILSLAPFIKSLSIEAPSNYLWSSGPLQATALPGLQSLFLQAVRLEGLSGFDTQPISWLCAPSLKRLRIRTNDSAIVLYLRINWCQLTHLDLSGSSADPTQWDVAASTFPVSSGFLSQFLQTCELLVECRLHLVPYNDEIHVPMHLPRLLRLAIKSKSDVRPFIDMLNAPALRELDVHFYAKGLLLANSFNRLFLSEKIETFVVDTVDPLRSDFLWCLRHCPLLKSLNFKRHLDSDAYGLEYANLTDDTRIFELGDTFLRQLSARDGHPVCPLLEDLICGDGRIIVNFSFPALIDFIEHKQSGASSLAKLKKFRIRRSEFVDMVRMLDPVLSDGISFNVYVDGDDFFDNEAHLYYDGPFIHNAYN